jgi:hypothetical protein
VRYVQSPHTCGVLILTQTGVTAVSLEIRGERKQGCANQLNPERNTDEAFNLKVSLF